MPCSVLANCNLSDHNIFHEIISHEYLCSSGASANNSPCDTLVIRKWTGDWNYTHACTTRNRNYTYTTTWERLSGFNCVSYLTLGFILHPLSRPSCKFKRVNSVACGEVPKCDFLLVGIFWNTDVQDVTKKMDVTVTAWYSPD